MVIVLYYNLTISNCNPILTYCEEHNESVPDSNGKTITTCTSVVEHYSETETCKLNELKVFQFKFSMEFILTWSAQLYVKPYTVCKAMSVYL